MVSAGANINRRGSGVLLLVLFALSLACLALPEAAESGVATAWVRRYNGSANGWDEATAMVLDSQGNVLITGRLERSGKEEVDYDYLTIKYSPMGKRLWVRRYDRPGNGSINWDQATAIAVDNQDNVYVTGWSFEGAGGWTTIKYSPDGVRLWVRFYKGGDSGDSTPSIVVDSQGNAYVTGSSWGGYKTGNDYTTIKYSPDGEELWVRFYNGSEYDSWSYDIVTAIALDGQNNVYVTGSSGYDYLTIKYNSEGEELWVRRYSAADSVHDRVRAMAVDGQGNVYVTGESVTKFFEKTGYRNSTYLTIKYDTNGQLLWAQHYKGDTYENLNNPAAIAVDSQGNVHVTGGIGYYSSEYQTIKYNPEGQLLWTKRYYGGGGGAMAMALDSHGSVYVAGYGDHTIKYSPSGDEVWVRRENMTRNEHYYYQALSLDSQNNVYVTGFAHGLWTDYDCVTIKYIQSPRTGR